MAITPPERPQKVAQGMYQLKKNTCNGVKNGFGRKEEKEDHNVYLLVSQWKELDRLAEERNVSRNEVLRQILSEYLQNNGGRE